MTIADVVWCGKMVAFCLFFPITVPCYIVNSILTLECGCFDVCAPPWKRRERYAEAIQRSQQGRLAAYQHRLNVLQHSEGYRLATSEEKQRMLAAVPQEVDTGVVHCKHGNRFPSPA
jgi:hypothetical protein